MTEQQQDYELIRLTMAFYDAEAQFSCLVRKYGPDADLLADANGIIACCAGELVEHLAKRGVIPQRSVG